LVDFLIFGKELRCHILQCIQFWK